MSTPESLAETYQVMYAAYARIFTRLGLRFRAVEADTGAIGGNASHEFQVLADSGEDAIAYSDGSDYAANVEMAEALAPAVERPAPRGDLEARGHARHRRPSRRSPALLGVDPAAMRQDPPGARQRAA